MKRYANLAAGVKRYANPAVTAAAATATVLPALTGGPRAWWVLPLAVASSVPVLWRERALLPVSLVVGAATTVSAALGAPPLLPVGPLVCLYTFAVSARPAMRLLGVTVTAAGVLFSLLYPRPDLEVLRYLTVAYVFAYALGTSTRARRTQAVALAERDRRLAGEREAAVLRERTRIARDLHDIVTHAVGIMIVQAEAGRLLVRPEPDRADAAFATVAATGRAAVAQLRRAVGGLREPADQPGGQPGLAHLPALVESVRAAGLDAALAVCGTPVAPPADIGVAAYRIVQESLTNVLRHARARSVRVVLEYAARSLAVSVTDDGAGHRTDDRTGNRTDDRNSNRTGYGTDDRTGNRTGDGAGNGAAGTGAPGYGIIGMRERAQACGGTLQAGPTGGGFTVAAAFPLEATVDA